MLTAVAGSGSALACMKFGDWALTMSPFWDRTLAQGVAVFHVLTRASTDAGRVKSVAIA